MTVPNVSEGRDLATLEAIGRAFAPAHFLDLHTDPDHDRAVFTLAARQGEMAQALLSGARSPRSAMIRGWAPTYPLVVPAHDPGARIPFPPGLK
jgi:hypothetical protein